MATWKVSVGECVEGARESSTALPMAVTACSEGVVKAEGTTKQLVKYAPLLAFLER